MTGGISEWRPSPAGGLAPRSSLRMSFRCRSSGSWSLAPLCPKAARFSTWRDTEHLFSIGVSMPSPPWQVKSGIDATIAGWLASGYVRPCLVADRAFESTEGSSVPLPASLGEGVRRALAERGIRELYSHQADALELALSGRDFVVATPTASGKSLCFHLPLLE